MTTRIISSWSLGLFITFALLITFLMAAPTCMMQNRPMDLHMTVDNAQRELMTPELADLTVGPGLTVSGLSSGAFMASQLSVAFSRLIASAGIIAGGPFNAAQGNVLTAVTIMEHPQFINMALMYTQLGSYQLMNQIDPTSALSAQTNYIFAGTKDSTLNPYNSVLVKQMYTAYGSKTVDVLNIAAEHAFLTTVATSNPCDFNGPPYINNCDFDLMRSMLSSFYPQQSILPPVTPIISNLHELDQYLFIPPQYGAFQLTNGLQRKSYVYIPEACEHILKTPLFNTIKYDNQRVKDSQNPGAGRFAFEDLRTKLWYEGATQQYMNSTNANDFSTILYDVNHDKKAFSNAGQAQCKVHIALHGCRQTLDDIQMDFILKTGYLEFAESNNIITIFPQAQATITNPKGCWDWWGYSTSNYFYSTKYGVQPLSIINTALSLNSLLQP